MSKTETGPKKRGNWLKEAKAKADAIDAMLAEHGLSSVEELNEKLAGLSSQVPQEVAQEQYRRAAIPEELAGATLTAVADPLACITKETPYVELVSSTTNFLLRQKNNHVQPPVTRISLKAYELGAWGACPFHVGDRDDHIHDKNVKVFKGKWWKIRVTRQLAEMLYADERHPKPTHHVVDPKGYRGWDRRSGCAKGDMVPIEEFVPLREVVRYCLQKAQETFMNHAIRPRGFDFDPRTPNPYRNRITDVVLEMKPPPKEWPAPDA